jgi:hypothetical protein
MATSCAGAVAVAGAGAGVVAVTAAATGARLLVSGSTVSVAVRTRIVSCAPADDCGVDAVDTGGAPLPTDSPQALATNSTGARMRVMANRDVRDMSDEIYASTEARRTPNARVWHRCPKANRAPIVASGDDWRLSVTSLLRPRPT